jgi:hypothetical protein
MRIYRILVGIISLAMDYTHSTVYNVQTSKYHDICRWNANSHVLDALRAQKRVLRTYNLKANFPSVIIISQSFDVLVVFNNLSSTRYKQWISYKPAQTVLLYLRVLWDVTRCTLVDVYNRSAQLTASMLRVDKGGRRTLRHAVDFLPHCRTFAL